MLFDLLPLWYQYTYVGVLGLIIGSFLNVYIYRLHTGKSLAGHSHCLSCGTGLRPYELVPLFSYLFLKGRCRTCGCYIPVRYFIVELVTALFFLLAYSVAASLEEFVYLAILLCILTVITVYDIRHFIIPDSLTAALLVLTLVWQGYLVYLGGAWETLVMTLGAAVIGAGFFFFLWFISNGRWIGFGDVKLAIPLGIMVGPTMVFSMVVFSFWIGAAVSLLLIGLSKLIRGQVRLQNRIFRLTIKSVVPFAPFLVAGSLLVLFTHINVLSFFSSL
jgi:leader peptidase (prepilin peptidase) / N-methyltransferase